MNKIKLQNGFMSYGKSNSKRNVNSIKHMKLQMDYEKLFKIQNAKAYKCNANS